MHKLSNLEAQAWCIAWTEALKKSKPCSPVSLLSSALQQECMQTFYLFKYILWCSSFQKAINPKHPENKGKSGSIFLPRKVRHIQSPWGTVRHTLTVTLLTLFLLLASSSRFLLPHPLITFSLLHPTPLPQLLFLLLPSTLHTSTCFTTPVSFSFSAGHSYT